MGPPIDRRPPPSACPALYGSIALGLGFAALLLVLSFTLPGAEASPSRKDQYAVAYQNGWVTAGITRTDQWVNFFSQSSYLSGSPLPLGAAVRAYNPRGVLSGEFTVTHEGWYGLLTVYRDDPSTPEDEGLLPGERVAFTIDGISARPTGPDEAI